LIKAISRSLGRWQKTWDGFHFRGDYCGFLFVLAYFLHFIDSKFNSPDLDVGLMFLLALSSNFTTAILFTVAFGIAVDDSYHFMTRLRKRTDERKKPDLRIKAKLF